MHNSKYLDQGNKQYILTNYKKVCFPTCQVLGETYSHLVAKSVANCMSINCLFP